jgi:uncharacterized protein (TIRG00374 family)
VKQGHVWVGIGISSLLVVYLFSRVDYRQLWISMVSADMVLLGCAGAALAATFAIRSWRWRYLLRPLKRVGFSSLMAATSIGLMANMIFPFRLGEIVRAVVLGHKERLDGSASFATVVVDRLLDGFTVLLILAILLLVAPLPLDHEWESRLRWGGFLFFALYLGVFALLFALLRSQEKVLGGIQRISWGLPAGWVDKFCRFLASFSGGLHTLERTEDTGQIIVTSLMLWGLIGIYNFLVVSAFHLKLPLTVGFLLLVVQAIAVMVPSSPGFVGTYHAATVACLSLWGVNAEEALSVAVVMHAINFLLAIGMGLSYLWSVKLSLRDFTRPKLASPPSSSAPT